MTGVCACGSSTKGAPASSAGSSGSSGGTDEYVAEALLLAHRRWGDDGAATPFLQAAWDQGTPTGQYRYYDGMLYMLSMLYLSGTFNRFY